MRLIPFARTALLDSFCIAVDVKRDPTGGLTICWSLEGDLACLNIPETGANLPIDRLWRYTCFEVFIRALDKQQYREFNFSPSGQFMMFDFDRYRERVANCTTQHLMPQMEWIRRSEILHLNVKLDDVFLPQKNAPLALGVSAVLEHRSGEHSYWALKHSIGQPDFHHFETFICTIP